MDISLQQQRAREVIEETQEFLRFHNRETTAELLNDLWYKALPYLRRAAHATSIHHAAIVTSHVIRIALDEINRNAAHAAANILDILIPTAIFHDSGFALISRDQKKIRKSDVESATTQRQRNDLRLESMRLRLAHGSAGAKIVEEVLSDAGGYAPETIQLIARLIKIHDYPSVAEMEPDPKKRLRFLFPDDFLGWLAAIHREADRLWMLTLDGVIEDIAAAMNRDRYPSFEGQMLYNVERHRQEGALYWSLLAERCPALGIEADTAFYRTCMGKYLFSTLPIASLGAFKAVAGHLSQTGVQWM